jgi:hypothetical protein
MAAISTPLWRSPLFVWIKSNLLNGEDYFRLGSLYPNYSGSSWPIGIALKRDPDTGADPASLIIDGYFDSHVKGAFRLPWRHSGLHIGTTARQSAANFTIENIGRWNGEPDRFTDISSALSQRRVNFSGGQSKQLYAITPFCIIAQRWIEYDDPAEPSSITDTYLSLFYTFDTFLQESLAREAFRAGHSIDTIVAAYQHSYANTNPIDAIPQDPADFALSRLVGPTLPWDDIRTTSDTVNRPNRMGGTSANRPRYYRERLASCRLQAHLMVGVAVALHGLASFQQGEPSSPLVQVSTSPPTQDMLAGFWLRHLFGSYDYASQCDALLVSLAHRYGRPPLSDRAGQPVPASLHPRSSAELGIALTSSPMWGGRDEPNPLDLYRWFLFDTPLDDDSILAWERKVARLVNSGER